MRCIVQYTHVLYGTSSGGWQEFSRFFGEPRQPKNAAAAAATRFQPTAQAVGTRCERISSPGRGERMPALWPNRNVTVHRGGYTGIRVLTFLSPLPGLFSGRYR